MKNFKIKSKLLVLVSFLLLTLAALGTTSIFLMNELNESSTELANNWLPSVLSAGKLNTLTSDYRIQEYGHILSTDKASMKSIEDTITDLSTQITEYFTKYQELITNDEDQKLLDSAKSSWQEYENNHKKLIELSTDGKQEEAFLLLKGESKQLFDTASEAFSKLVAFNETGGSNASTDADEVYISSKNTVIITLISIIIISILMALYIIRLISQPVKELDSVAKDIAEGNLDKAISYKSKDELGQLAFNFNKTVTRLRDYVNYIDEIAKVLDDIANGDLVFSLKYDYAGEFAKIKYSLEHISNSLNDTLGQINQSADQVASGSDQVASGAQMLSQGATEQASSVEELAATITDVAEKIKLNAINAVDTGKKVSSLGNEIEESNNQMTKMMKAMENIDATSDEISKIIKTIEDIAFQTNILSLNAAVEAARAGDAGKGFAVVAEEVRILASRSADAANNTTTLIEGVLTAVKDGTAIANKTADYLKKVVIEAAEVTKKVNTISTASEEQADAVTQIRDGVDQISTVVQSNSATAEESAATSEELSGQAQILKDLISRFKLNGVASSSSSYKATTTKQPTYRPQTHTTHTPPTHTPHSSDNINIDLVYNPNADISDKY